MKYLVPNAITALSMLFGLASMASAAAGDLPLAGWFILWGVLLDTVDGAAARLLDASSAFGAQFDSFSDFVVFGLAPATLVFFLFEADVEPNASSGIRQWLLRGSAAAFVLATAARLARFNTAPSRYGADYFEGIPSTSCGALIALLYLSWQRQALSAWLLEGYPLVLLGCAAAMLSPLKLPRLKPSRNPIINLFMGVCVVMAYTLAPLRVWPEALLVMEVIALSGSLLWAARPQPTGDVPSG